MLRKFKPYVLKKTRKKRKFIARQISKGQVIYKKTIGDISSGAPGREPENKKKMQPGLFNVLSIDKVV